MCIRAVPDELLSVKRLGARLNLRAAAAKKPFGRTAFRICGGDGGTRTTASLTLAFVYVALTRSLELSKNMPLARFLNDNSSHGVRVPVTDLR